MELYRELTKEERGYVSKKIKGFENVKISEPVELNGNTYREIIFKKKIFSKLRENGTAYCYIDSSNNIVTNENTIIRLGRLFFFMDAFLTTGKGSIVSAFLNEGDKTRNKNDLEFILEGLEQIKKKGDKYNITSNDVEQVKDILIIVNEMREDLNNTVEKFLEVVEGSKKKHKIFNESFIDECMPQYKELMIGNYNKMQIINKGRRHYNTFKKAANSIRRKYTLVFITKHNEQLMRVHYMMGYFESLLQSYDTIISMNQSQYTKAIVNAGKANAEYKKMYLR